MMALDAQSRQDYAQDRLDDLEHDTTKPVNLFFATIDQYHLDSAYSEEYTMFLLKKKMNHVLTVAIAERYTPAELKTYEVWKKAAIERDPGIREMGKILGVNLYAIIDKNPSELECPITMYLGFPSNGTMDIRWNQISIVEYT